LYSPSLKRQKDCRSHQQKVQEEVQETNRLLEDTEKHLGAMQDCQGSLRIEEQQVQSQIDEIVLKINMLTEERESVTEKKVCCLCCFYYQPSPPVVQPDYSTLSLPKSITGHDPEPLPVTCQFRAIFPGFHHNDIFPAS